MEATIFDRYLTGDPTVGQSNPISQPSAAISTSPTLGYFDPHTALDPSITPDISTSSDGPTSSQEEEAKSNTHSDQEEDSDTSSAPRDRDDLG